nr:hypothetical protein Iba_chr04aCG18750 [Ipomoea batatas]
MENLASITDMIDEFEESLAKKKQQKKPLPSPSPVVIMKKNVCCANAGKTKECSKTMESPTNGQPQDQFGTKLIISEPREELVVPKTNMASEDKSLQRCSQEAQSVGGAKKGSLVPRLRRLNFLNVVSVWICGTLGMITLLIKTLTERVCVFMLAVM